jgi:hypothetical protein
MIFAAADRLKLDRATSWVIGDAPRDIAAGHAAGCRTILFTEPSIKVSSATEEPSSAEPDFTASSLEEAVDIIERNTMQESETETSAEPTEATSENDPTTVAADPPAAPPESGAASPSRKMTFAERVRAGNYQPARAAVAPGVVVAERPKREAAAATAKPSTLSRGVKADPSTSLRAEETPPAARPTEPVDPAELIEPLLQQILEEVRLMRQQSHTGTEFSVTKLLAGVMQVLVLPALFFAYLHRDTPVDLQSLLLLATFLQTLTIALLIMGKQQ